MILIVFIYYTICFMVSNVATLLYLSIYPGIVIRKMYF